jgi:hypothetical protein
MHDPERALTPAQIKPIRLKSRLVNKEFERMFGIPARTMESYEQGRHDLDGAMRALLRIIDRGYLVSARQAAFGSIVWPVYMHPESSANALDEPMAIIRRRVCSGPARAVRIVEKGKSG